MTVEILEKEKKLLDQVCHQIENSGIVFDMIIGIATGGLLPTRIIANFLKVRNVDVVSVNSYGDDHQRGEIRLLVDKNLEHLQDKTILIVDDLVDNGATMKYVQQLIFSHNPKLVKTAVIYKKNRSIVQPDFYGLEVPHDEWITFSWDI